MNNQEKNAFDHQKAIVDRQQAMQRDYKSRIQNENVRNIVDSEEQASDTDPDGSYTGITEIPFALPQQDVDDL